LHWTTHVVVGATAGYLVERPLPSLIVGFASHPLLDITPHHDPDHDIGYVLDTVAGVGALSILLFNRLIRSEDRHRAILWGAIGGALPDMELLVKLFKDIETEDYKFPWHNGTLPHRQTHLAGSVISQTVLIAVMLSLAWLKFRRMRKKGS